MLRISFLLLLAFTSFVQTIYADTLDKINHIVIIYLENRSFDNLYGLFPGAEGVQGLTPAQYQQVDNDGKPFSQLPPVWKNSRGDIDPAFSGKPPLPNRPFQLNAPPYNLALNMPSHDLTHLFYVNQEQINHGKNNRFAAASNAGGLVMGYYDGSSMKLWQLARQYTLADHFFMGAFGGSFLNHFWLACACAPEFPGAPAKLIAKLEDDGVTLKRGFFSHGSAMDGPPSFSRTGPITPDLYAVDAVQPPYQPSKIPPAPGGDPRFADPSQYPLPPQTAKTIGDALSEKGISWAWYTNDFNRAVAEYSQPAEVREKASHQVKFSTHHLPYNYFKNYAPGTKARAEHLKDLQDLLAAIKAGTLPQVVFYKPDGIFSQHPGMDNIVEGDAHVADLVAQIQKSPLWNSTLIIITYDENGGFWDHVPPPKGDRFGPGTRIPAILISPYVKKGFVDHTQYDTTSILKLITRRFGLEPLPGLRANMGDLTEALVE
ncbi:MAG TPA: acid phosphatase [Gammaproteobacteria bacterium]|nr:acid phosphatase [Gammaproteobacteria bacterium]